MSFMRDDVLLYKKPSIHIDSTFGKTTHYMAVNILSFYFILDKIYLDCSIKILHYTVK